MTDPIRPPVLAPMPGDPRPDEEEDELPEHEHDDDRVLGGGVMSTGGTAVDRGTGTLDGEAQGPLADDDESDPLQAPVDTDEVVPNTRLPG